MINTKRFTDKDGWPQFQGIHKDLLIQFIERFDPVVIKCDDGYYLSPMNGCDEDIENACVYSRQAAIKALGEDEGEIISIFDL